MDFEDLYNRLIPTEKGILQRIDEYTLYCYYTKIDNLIPGRAYPAPYRTDNKPSFTVYYSKKEDIDFMWKDQATSESGSIFKLIEKIEQLSSRQEVFERINMDFDLEYDLEAPIVKEKIALFKHPERTEIKISIVEQPLSTQGKSFWNQWRIGQDLLDFYKTAQVKYYWTYLSQPAPNTAPDPMFAYRMGNYFQLYSPYVQKEDKFRNDWPESYFFGYLQLPERGEDLIIDKSCKDVIFCKRLGYLAVCGKSETTFVPQHKMLELKERFTNIYLMLDNDKAGIAMTEKYLQMYPWLKPRTLEFAKDKTDLCKLIGFEETISYLKQLIK